MIVRYVWHEDPGTEKIFDTEIALAKNPPSIDGSRNRMTQEEYDEMTLRHLCRDYAAGLVLSYGIEKE